jgi:ribosome-associated protein
MDIVPRKEIIEKFSRAGGAGGQNVNKLSTKAEARWNVGKSKAFTQEEKEKIRRALGNKINAKRELVVVSQIARTQRQNRELAIERLNNLVKSALIPKKKRKPTKPTKASKERRLTGKKRLKEKKMWRKKPAQGWSA